MKQNALSTKKAANDTTDLHMKAHAQAWRHIDSLAPNDLKEMAEKVSYVTPILGRLSADPDVTRKDVIKAVADGVNDGKSTPSDAIHFISQIPEDQAALHNWLKGLYAVNLSALIHMKAAQGIPQAGPSAAPAAMPAAMPASAPPATAVTQQ